MFAYLWLLALPVLLALGRRAGPRRERWALLLTWIALTLFVGLRRNVGGDWGNYLLMHARAGSHPLFDAIMLGDPVYMLISGLLFRFGFALVAVNLVCAAIFAGGLVLFVRVQPRPALALIIAYPVLIAVAAFATRQSAAIGLLLAALAMLSAGRTRLAASLVLLAPGFHWTAILLLPLLPATLIRAWPPRLTIAAGAAAGLGLAALLALTPMGERFDNVGASAGAPLRAGFFLLTLIVLAVRWRRLGLDEREFSAGAFLAALGLFALALTPVLSTAGDRIGYYAVPLQMMVLPRAALSLSSPALQRTAQWAIAILYAGIFAAWLALSPYHTCLVPYRTYLVDPAAIRILDPEQHRRSSPCGAGPRQLRMQSRSNASAAPAG